MPMRVLAVADVYEALISDRPYRPAYPWHEALELMRRDVPQRLDSRAFAALEALLRKSMTGGPSELTGGARSLRRIK
jgi:HD-GYP domain-containing protein (c-di-GMP phosphodiesterase class II)